MSAVLAVCGVGTSILVWMSRSVPDSVRPGPFDRVLRSSNTDGRHGVVYVPVHEHGSALPLLIALHGTGGDGRSILASFRALADKHRFIVVAPDSRRAPNGQWSWEVATHAGDRTDDYRHVLSCVYEVLADTDLQVDRSRVLVAGFSGGASSAPYLASNDDVFTAFAVLHGGVFVGGLGSHHVPGWFSTGRADAIRAYQGVNQAAESMRQAGFNDITVRDFPGGHELSRDELRALIEWWLAL